MLDQASRTAADVAAVRALCSAAPPGQRIMYDALSLQMIPPPWRFWRFMLSGPLRSINYQFLRSCAHFKSGSRGMCEVVALRYRHIDDQLQDAYERGIRQVLLLGAGFDYRAYRPEYTDVHFIEVDHPATQAAKLALLDEHHVSTLGRVSYIGVDFMGDWASTLQQSGALGNEPTFVIWEGVAYYLDGQAVCYTLQTLLDQLPADSQLIFDCAPVQDDSARELQRAARYAASHGEPMLWGGTMHEVEALLNSFHLSTPKIHRFSDLMRTLMVEESLSLPIEPVFDQFYMVEVVLNGRPPHIA
ncbi:SAM-dependent methyltransferase [Chitinivorax sp. B]|uniref:class I SAM-dependent methyltransferase n=1 Tax=Chitinivorax sp. B TaxID=2502235 RepID=UPI0010F90F92|nr:SAM-dependent methyltransferase [Chitinivorax sp. B]